MEIQQPRYLGIILYEAAGEAAFHSNAAHECTSRLAKRETQLLLPEQMTGKTAVQAVAILI